MNKMLIYFLTGLLVLLLGCTAAESQTISGNLSAHAGQELRLEGFRGLETYEISRTRVGADGSFSLRYDGEAPGMGLLIPAEGRPFVVVLSGEDLRLEGGDLSAPETVQIRTGAENLLFEQYAAEHPRREQALSAWVYLNRMYREDALFAPHATPREAIAAEMARIRAEDDAFLASLDPDTYVSWYLPVRRLVSAVPVVAQFRTEEIPATVAAFRGLDHTDPRLHRSGLLRDVLESHVWLIENSGRGLDAVFEELNVSLRLFAENLHTDAEKFSPLAEFMFDLLEQRSLFASSEYFAELLLSDYDDLLTRRLRAKLQIYGELRLGSTGPDFEFGELIRRPDGVTATRLSEVDADYVLLIFAAGWCPFCREMKPELMARYPGWRAQGVEVVMVSLDDDPDIFEQYTRGMDFLSTTDLKRWESPAAQAWHVYSVPTFWLLDRNRRIILKPNSVRHMEAWVDWHLVQGNPLPRR